MSLFGGLNDTLDGDGDADEVCSNASGNDGSPTRGGGGEEDDDEEGEDADEKSGVKSETSLFCF